MSIKDSEPVQKVRSALKDAGLDDKVVELSAPVEKTAETAKTLDTEPGAIVLTKVYAIGKRMVLVLFAADHAPVEANLGPAFFLEGDVRQPADAEVKGLTGFAADCVPPVGLSYPLPTVIDASIVAPRSESSFSCVHAPASTINASMLRYLITLAGFPNSFVPTVTLSAVTVYVRLTPARVS